MCVTIFGTSSQKRHFIQHRSIHTRVHFDCVGVVQHKYQRVIQGDASAPQCFNLPHSLSNYSLAADFPGGFILWLVLQCTVLTFNGQSLDLLLSSGQYALYFMAHEEYQLLFAYLRQFNYVHSMETYSHDDITQFTRMVLFCFHRQPRTFKC